MRTSADLYVEWVEDEAVALDRKTGELHYLNPPAAAVLALIQEHGYEEGVAQAVAGFGLDAQDPELHALLLELAEAGMLIREGVPAPAPVPPSAGEPRAAAG